MRLSKETITKEDIEMVEKMTANHARYCKNIWKVDFYFDHYDPEVHCFYVRDMRIAGREILRYIHLSELEKLIHQKYGKRCGLGIIYENAPAE